MKRPAPYTRDLEPVTMPCEVCGKEVLTELVRTTTRDRDGVMRVVVKHPCK